MNSSRPEPTALGYIARAAGVVVALIVFVAALIVLAPSPSHAAGRHHPAKITPRGCTQQWLASDSNYAKRCRNHGWTVTSLVVIAPSGWVRTTSLLDCAVPRQNGTCVWWGGEHGTQRSYVNLRGRHIVVRGFVTCHCDDPYATLGDNYDSGA